MRLEASAKHKQSFNLHVLPTLLIDCVISGALSRGSLAANYSFEMQGFMLVGCVLDRRLPPALPCAFLSQLVITAVSACHSGANDGSAFMAYLSTIAFTQHGCHNESRARSPQIACASDCPAQPHIQENYTRALVTPGCFECVRGRAGVAKCLRTEASPQGGSKQTPT